LKTELPCYGSEGEEEDLSSSPIENYQLWSTIASQELVTYRRMVDASGD